MKKYEMKITFTDKEFEELIWSGIRQRENQKIFNDMDLETFPITLKTIYEDCKFCEENGDWSAPYPQVELKEIELNVDDNLRPLRLLEEEMNMREE